MLRGWNKSGYCTGCGSRQRNKIRMLEKRKTATINKANLGGEE